MYTKSRSPVIAICVATYQRPKLLDRLLESLNKMDRPRGARIELRLVDNDFHESGRQVVEQFESSNKLFSAIHYMVEPRQNIALARNACLDIGPAEAVAFIDDDEEAAPNWIKSLWDAYQDTGADGVFGPVKAVFSKKSPKWVKDGGFMEKTLPATGGKLDWKQTRTSNALIKGRWFYAENSFRFDPKMGRSGGSDTHMFARMESIGAEFISCREASVSETVPANRASFSWLWNRRYRNGLIYERIVARVSSDRHPLTRFIRRLASSVLMIAKGLPGVLKCRPSETINGALQIPLAFGGLIAWLKPNTVARHVAYQKGFSSSNEPQNSQDEKAKVAFLTNIVSPYRIPVFKNLATRNDWNFQIYTNSRSEFDRKWDVNTDGLSIKQSRSWSWKRTVRCKEPTKFVQKITLHFPYGLLFDLIAFRPSVVISQELGLRTLIAAIYCAMARAPLVIWAYQSRVSSAQGSWRNSFRRFLLRRASTVLGMGIQSREVLRKWGVPDERIIDALNAADHDSLSNQLLQAEASELISNIRAKSAKNKKMALFAGRLIPLKGIAQLLDAWKGLSENTKSEWELVVLGNGPLEPMVKESSEDSVSTVGYVGSDEIAFWYAAADLHIFPTCGDVWGLVVNEASACGTPTLCSIHAGCSDDLINNESNGLSIDFTDPENRSSILEAALNRSDLEEMGRNARFDIAKYTPDNLANSFRNAVSRAQKKNDSAPPVAKPTVA